MQKKFLDKTKQKQLSLVYAEGKNKGYRVLLSKNVYLEETTENIEGFNKPITRKNYYLLENGNIRVNVCSLKAYNIKAQKNQGQKIIQTSEKKEGILKRNRETVNPINTNTQEITDSLEPKPQKRKLNKDTSNGNSLKKLKIKNLFFNRFFASNESENEKKDNPAYKQDKHYQNPSKKNNVSLEKKRETNVFEEKFDKIRPEMVVFEKDFDNKFKEMNLIEKDIDLISFEPIDKDKIKQPSQASLVSSVFKEKNHSEMSVFEFNYLPQMTLFFKSHMSYDDGDSTISSSQQNKPSQKQIIPSSHIIPLEPVHLNIPRRKPINITELKPTNKEPIFNKDIISPASPSSVAEKIIESAQPIAVADNYREKLSKERILRYSKTSKLALLVKPKKDQITCNDYVFSTTGETVCESDTKPEQIDQFNNRKKMKRALLGGKRIMRRESFNGKYYKNSGFFIVSDGTKTSSELLLVSDHSVSTEDLNQGSKFPIFATKDKWAVRHAIYNNLLKNPINLEKLKQEEKKYWEKKEAMEKENLTVMKKKIK